MASPLVTSLDNLLLPRVTTTERNAITPVNGMLVFDTTLGMYMKYEGILWLPIDAGLENFRRAGTDFAGFGTSVTTTTDLTEGLRATIANSATITRNTTSFSDATGVVDFNTNLNSAGRVCVYSFGWYLGAKQVVHKARFKIPVLATSAQNFTTGIGLVNASSLASFTEGVLVYCANGTNSGNWVIQATYGGLTTTFNTSIAPVADTFTDITIYINAAGNQVRVFFNTTEPSGVGYPVTTNIPAASASQLFGAVCLEKTNGTTNRIICVDKLNTYNF